MAHSRQQVSKRRPWIDLYTPGCGTRPQPRLHFSIPIRRRGRTIRTSSAALLKVCMRLSLSVALREGQGLTCVEAGLRCAGTPRARGSVASREGGRFPPRKVDAFPPRSLRTSSRSTSRARTEEAVSHDDGQHADGSSARPRWWRWLRPPLSSFGTCRADET